MADENGGTPQATQQQAPAQTAPKSWDEWLSGQDETVQELADSHVHGLKSALDSERKQRQDMAKQLKALEKNAEAGSEAAKALGELTARLEQAERQAAFYAVANTPEIGCSNPRAAFLVAQASGHFTRSGEPDWKAIRAEAPELFRQRGSANGGAGTNSPPKAASMNDFIRAAAGRG